MSISRAFSSSLTGYLVTRLTEVFYLPLTGGKGGDGLGINTNKESGLLRVPGVDSRRSYGKCSCSERSYGVERSLGECSCSKCGYGGK